MADSRKQTKAESRRRLLDATLEILDREGEGALTTTRVANLAGLSQPSFYVHFADMSDLLQSVADEVLVGWADETVEARRVAREAPTVDRYRETFRIPLRQGVENPRLFRLMMRHRFDETSRLGDWSRSVYDIHRAALVGDLRANGFPYRTARQKRVLEMVADGLVALSTEMVAGLIDGRYADLEEAVDVLMAFSVGYLTLGGDGPTRTTRSRATP